MNTCYFATDDLFHFFHIWLYLCHQKSTHGYLSASLSVVMSFKKTVCFCLSVTTGGNQGFSLIEFDWPESSHLGLGIGPCPSATNPAGLLNGVLFHPHLFLFVELIPTHSDGLLCPACSCISFAGGFCLQKKQDALSSPFVLNTNDFTLLLSLVFAWRLKATKTFKLCRNYQISDMKDSN